MNHLDRLRLQALAEAPVRPARATLDDGNGLLQVRFTAHDILGHAGLSNPILGALEWGKSEGILSWDYNGSIILWDIDGSVKTTFKDAEWPKNFEYVSVWGEYEGILTSDGREAVLWDQNGKVLKRFISPVNEGWFEDVHVWGDCAGILTIDRFGIPTLLGLDGERKRFSAPGGFEDFLYSHIESHGCIWGVSEGVLSWCNWEADRSAFCRMTLWDKNAQVMSQFKVLREKIGRIDGVRLWEHGDGVLSWGCEAYGWNNHLILWNSIGDVQRRFPLPRNWRIQGAEILGRDRGVLAWGTDHFSSSGEIILFDIEAGITQHFRGKHTNDVLGALYWEDSDGVLSWSKDGSLILWNLDGSVRRVFAQPDGAHHDVRGVKVWGDFQRLLSWNIGGPLVLWEMNSNQRRVLSGPHGPTRFVRGALALSDRREVLSWGEDGELLLWNADDFAEANETRQSYPKRIIGVEDWGEQESLLVTYEDGSLVLSSLDGIEQQRFVPNEEVSGSVGAVFLGRQEGILSWNGGRCTLWGSDGQERSQFDLPYLDGIKAVYAWREHGAILVCGHSVGAATYDVDGQLLAKQVYGFDSNLFLEVSVLSKEEIGVFSDDRMEIWSPRGNEVFAFIDRKGETGDVLRVLAFPRTGRILSFHCANDAMWWERNCAISAILWERSGRVRRRYKICGDGNIKLGGASIWAGNDAALAWGSDNDRGSIWLLPSGRGRFLRFVDAEGHRYVVDGALAWGRCCGILSWSFDSLLLWDLDGKVRTRFASPNGHRWVSVSWLAPSGSHPDRFLGPC